jgi:phage gpG-like protein
MSEFSLLGFASLITSGIVHQHVEEQHALHEACKVLEKEAKRVIGTYDYGWPQLAASTQADRASKGFNPNDPLLRTGDLRESIEHSVGDREAMVGSNDKKAEWQELGTNRIPPRSFLAMAAQHKEHEIHAILGKAMLPLKLVKP